MKTANSRVRSKRFLPCYTVIPLAADFNLSESLARRRAIPALRIRRYLWLGNGYRPPAEARLAYSRRHLYLFFRVEEKEILARFTRFQDPVYKDSCVEFFFDPFPEKQRGYVNIEANPLGTLQVGFGPGRQNRLAVRQDATADFQTAGSINSPVSGRFGADAWTLGLRIPLFFFTELYGEEIRPGLRARGNFYVCGDDTPLPHYGAWSPIDAPVPDFHRPEFFGNLIFG